MLVGQWSFNLMISLLFLFPSTTLSLTQYELCKKKESDKQHDNMMINVEDSAIGQTTSQTVSSFRKGHNSCGNTLDLIQKTSFLIPARTRRNVLASLIVGCLISSNTKVGGAYQLSDIEVAPSSENIKNNEIISSLVYERILGQGGYKTVYLVKSDSSSSYADGKRLACAVEKLRSNKDIQNSLRGIRIVEKLQYQLANKGECQDCFERIEQWWFQSSSLPEFAPNEYVFPSTIGHSKEVPRKILYDSKWLVALKPVYDMDLKQFIQKSPTLFPVEVNSKTESSRIVAGINLNEVDKSALKLAYSMCEIGRLMHSHMVVHRDIKPENIMLHNGGQPVIIDFGFADFVQPRIGARLCIEEPGKIKGEMGYIISSDAERFQGCMEGDYFAMGKTMYEVFFGERTLSSLTSIQSKMTLQKIKDKEGTFRNLLSSNAAGRKSRFFLTNAGRSTLMFTIRRLCDKKKPISFDDAAECLKQEIRAL